MNVSRRGFLTAAAGLFAAAGAGLASSPVRAAASAGLTEAGGANAIEPFYGAHQGGIATPAQRHTYFAAFDLTTSSRKDVVALLKAWTAAAARMTAGKTAAPEGEGFRPAVDAAPADPPSGGDDDYAKPSAADQAADTGEALGLSPARLTLTFGFGPGLFIKEGKDRYGLAARRPEALIDLPKFAGDQLVEARTGGDLSVQACADDPQVAFHAIRQLVRIADGVAQLRWTQTGFLPDTPAGQTPRNLMGFKDGTDNPSVVDPAASVIWAEGEPAWMRGGSYLVARRIRIALEHWDRMKVAFQEQTVGRHKLSGAPLGKKNEHDPLDLDATDADGNSVIPENAHVRLGAPASNDGVQILRRGYSYNDGTNFTSERWPPWRQGLEYDAGLFFLSYQRDPRTGFVKIFERMSKFDMMNQFVTHIGGGLFACPPGAAPGEFIGQALFAAG
jgi:deferrochelatase/peroxidase EfeB